MINQIQISLGPSNNETETKGNNQGKGAKLNQMVRKIKKQ